MAPQIATLKAKHAEHILEVVRGAEKQEAVRQKKLRHATSKANYEYLQKRFSAERQQDQAHISGLVEDAQTVEAALIRGSRNNQEQNGNGQHQGHRSVDAGGNSSRGGGDDAGIAAGLGGGGSSMGGSIGTSKSTMSNAYVEPSEAKEDPNFISLDQMRFMKYVYAHVDGQKAARAHARLMTQLIGAEKSADKLEARRQRSSGSGGMEPLAGRSSAGTRMGGALAASSAPSVMGTAGGSGTGSSTVASSERKTTKPERGGPVARQHRGSGGGDGENSGHRQQLLEKKRGILLEMKGVVRRQAEALDRLVESGENKNRDTQVGERSIDHHNSSRRSRPFQESNGSSTATSSWFLHEARHRGDDNVGSRAASKATTAMQGRRSSRMSCLGAASNNNTSAFLARGGRWGGESSRNGGSSTRGSLASVSSASYATYCKRDRRGGGGEGRGVGRRRPGIVPALPL